MYVVTRTTTVPRDRLWTRLADVERWPDLLPTVTSVRRLDPGTPTAVGSRFEVRQPRLTTAVYTVTRWEPDRVFVWEARGPGLRAVATHELRPVAGGTELRLEVRWHGLLAAPVRLALGGLARDYLDREADAVIGTTTGGARA